MSYKGTELDGRSRREVLADLPDRPLAAPRRAFKPPPALGRGKGKGSLAIALAVALAGPVKSNDDYEEQTLQQLRQQTELMERQLMEQQWTRADEEQQELRSSLRRERDDDRRDER